MLLPLCIPRAGTQHEQDYNCRHIHVSNSQWWLAFPQLDEPSLAQDGAATIAISCCFCFLLVRLVAIAAISLLQCCLKLHKHAIMCTKRPTLLPPCLQGSKNACAHIVSNCQEMIAPCLFDMPGIGSCTVLHCYALTTALPLDHFTAASAQHAVVASTATRKDSK